MENIEIVDLTPGNIADYGVCGYKDVKKHVELRRKIEWFRRYHPLGPRIKAVIADGSYQGMLGYIPGKYAHWPSPCVTGPDWDSGRPHLERARPGAVPSSPFIEAHEVVRISLAERICTMARNPVVRRVRREPFAPEGELDDHRFVIGAHRPDIPGDVEYIFGIQMMIVIEGV